MIPKENDLYVVTQEEVNQGYIKEIFTGDNGQGSAKKFITLTSFLVCVIMAFVDLFTQYKINQEIFNIFMALTGFTPILSIADKKLNDNVNYSEDKKN